MEALSIIKEKLFPIQPNSQMPEFVTASCDEIHKIIGSASSASYSLNPLPTGLLEDQLDAPVPAITVIVNKVAYRWHIPICFPKMVTWI